MGLLMEELGLKLFSIGGAEGVSLMTLLLGASALLLGVMFLKLFSPPISQSPHPLKERDSSNVKSVDQLFLPIDYRPEDLGGQKKEGYLRRLTLKNATLVTNDHHLAKGSMLDVDLGGIPHKGGPPHYVKGRVMARKSLGGLPESFQLDIKLLETNRQRFDRICVDLMVSGKRKIDD